MSTSRVKRSYDALCGEESIMATSPQCSPMRAHTSVMADQHQTSAQAAFQPHHQQQQQRLNFDDCKEGDDSTQMQLESESHPAPAAQFSSFNTFSGGFSSTTFTSLQPTTTAPPQPHAHSSVSSSAFASQPRASPSYTSPAPMSKRTRRQGQHDVSMDDAEHGATDNAHESPFPKMKRAAVEDLLSVPRSYKKQAIAATLQAPSSSSHATPIAASSLSGLIPAPPSSTSQLPSYHHQLFTYDQVASIVRNAVEVREEQIREEYNRILQDQLREQFENFSSFNRDYISRAMKSRDNQEDEDNSYYS